MSLEGKYLFTDQLKGKQAGQIENVPDLRVQMFVERQYRELPHCCE